MSRKRKVETAIQQADREANEAAALVSKLTADLEKAQQAYKRAHVRSYELRVAEAEYERSRPLNDYELQVAAAFFEDAC